ncbi:MAG: STAS domain-containing protein [Planctomycetota bacterium]
MELKVIKENETVTHVALAGRLDIAGVQDVEGAFIDRIAARRKPVLVDMSEVAFLTSTGISMLIKAAEIMKSYGARMALLKPQPLVADTLRAAGIDHIMGMTDDEEKAMNLLKAVK